MIKFENTAVVGVEHAIRGMRNPMNSWDKSDSIFGEELGENYTKGCFFIGEADHKLMKSLCKAGPDHRKFLRMISVYVDITAPIFWWSEFDTYKVGVTRNSCSKMHKIHIKPFEIEDFSHEGCSEIGVWAMDWLKNIVSFCESLRQKFNETQDKKYWRALIEVLPEGYNMKATVLLNYEVLANIYKPTSRRHHKLDEWNVDCKGSFCDWIKKLPYSDLITGEE